MSDKHIRIGVIGLGVMGRYHANTLLEGKIARGRLAAVCDGFSAAREPFEGKVKTFSTTTELIQSGEVDAVIIATPHYSHTTIGIEAFEADLHVLVEKPISVHKADCQRLIEASRKRPGKIFSVMFNLRTTPIFQKLKQLIDSGELGKIQRVNWIVTTWFRTGAYYASGGWRATWAGEGGGVLLNQCPHQLDLFQWFFGMPDRVRSFCRFGQYHDIEVEDDVTAYMEWNDGKTGVFIASTGEAPGTDRLEIMADRGRVVMEAGKLSFTRNETAASDYIANGPRGGAPSIWNVEIPVAPAAAGGIGHIEITQNFVDAILSPGGPGLIAHGEEGLHSVELANAMLFSTFRDLTVDLPLDAEAYARALEERIQASPRKAERG